MVSAWRRWVADLGVLRLLLLFVALLGLLLIPAPGTRAVYSGWALATTVLVPVLVPMLFLLLLLDALMARVFMSDTAGAARKRWRTVITINLVVAALLLIRWLPYFAALRV